MSKELDDKQKAIKSEVNRGPGPSPEQYREYLIEILPLQAYRYNAQEIKLLANVKIDEVMDAIEDEFRGIAKAKR
jgi:hypothetical protein